MCTKFDDCSFSHSRKIIAALKLKLVTWLQTPPFQGQFVVTRIILHLDIQCTLVLWPSGLCPWLPGWASTSTNLDFTEARDSQWQRHQLCQICTSRQKHNTPAPRHSVFTGRMSFLPRLTNKYRKPTLTKNTDSDPLGPPIFWIVVASLVIPSSRAAEHLSAFPVLSPPCQFCQTHFVKLLPSC